MIQFSEIFDRAINLFDDPDINLAYTTNSVKYQKMLRPFLINGMWRFSNPLIISNALSNYNESDGYLEIFDGTGSDTYALSSFPIDNSVFYCTISGAPDTGAIYNSNDNTIKFSQIIENGKECSIEWYNAGRFNIDFGTLGLSGYLNVNSIEQRTIDILAHCTCLGFAEKNKNSILEIRNILTNSDFKIYSPANSVNAKINWFNNLQAELDDLTNKLTWDVKTLTLKGARFGR